MKIITRTVYGSKLQSSKLLGLQHVIDANTTLNEKFDIQSGVMPNPADDPDVRYFAIGRGGHRPITGADGIAYTTPINHRASDAACFHHMPFVLRDVNNDLTPEQRSKYALRKQETHGGYNYFAYYLKRLDLNGVVPEMRYTQVVDGVETTVPYTPTSSNLNPEPPEVSSSGVTTTDGNYLSTTASIKVAFDANDVLELLEVARIIYGNELVAVVSEIALCSGVDKIVPGPAAGGGNISYSEAIGVQVATHITTHYPMAFSNQGFEFTIDLGATEPLIGENVIITSP